MKGLYDRGLSAKQVRQLFRLIDWMLQLPEELEQEFRVELDRFEEERKMPYVTSVERLARKEGWQEGKKEGKEEGKKEGQEAGLQQGIVLALKVKFGAAGKRLGTKIRAIHDVKKLQSVVRAIESAQSLDEVAQAIA